MHLKTTSLCALLLLGLTACDPESAPHDAVDPASAADDARAPADDAVDLDDLGDVLRDGEVRLGEGIRTFSEVEVAGTHLMFLSVPDPETGELEPHLVQRSEPGAIRLSDEPALASASLLDIFLAAAPPELPVPAELRDLEDHGLGARGWFRAGVQRGDYVRPRATCIEAWFQEDLEAYGSDFGADAEDRYFFDSSPGANDIYNHWSGPHKPSIPVTCTNCSESWYHHNSGEDDYELYNVDAAKMAFVSCNLDSRPTICNASETSCLYHLGPQVQFWRRTENNADAQILLDVDLTVNGGDEWSWIGNASTAKNFDWRIRIRHARDADVFHLGYIWEHHGW